MPTTKVSVVCAVVSGVAVLGCATGEERPPCDPDNAGLSLPAGFCAFAVADDVGRARHLTVAANGDLFVALRADRGGESSGGVVALRDTDGDGRADVRRRFASGVGDNVEFRDGYLYYSTNDAVMRYRWRDGEMEPAGAPDTIVRDLPATRSHRTKTFAFGEGGALYVNVGSPSNSCQRDDRQPGVPGQDPCPQLATRAGIWRFHADSIGQTQADGVHFATGMRNTVALTVRPADGRLYGVIHGRDQLFQNWSRYYDEEDSAEKPAEEFVRVEQGDDFGWPYCYYDPVLERKLLAPEYGGNGERQGRCADKQDPLIAFPAHWAPDDILFYTGVQFPPRYRGGAFIAFHGSWNRAPLPQGGYNVVYVPFAGADPVGEWEVFADGFSTEPPQTTGPHRPVGLAQGPDGSLYVSDDTGARVYRIMYVGEDVE